MMQVKKQELATAIRLQMAEQGATTQLEMAEWLRKKGLRISQPTLSRILKGTYAAPPPSLVAVCTYASIPMNKFMLKANPADSERLMMALQAAWDGTPERELFLARIIRAAGRLGRA